MTATPSTSSTSTAIPVPRAEPESASDERLHGRARWMIWRSPDNQPAWSRPALLAIAALAAALYAWNIRSSGYALFYSTAVKSMSESWKAFFYGALDPGATITIDKLAGSFLPQALSARVFGFHQWSLSLPQVLEGVISVLVMHRIVRRWAGPVPAVLATGLFAFTPVVASMFGHPMEDGALTMCLVLAADSYQRAVLEGRLRSLMLAGVWVGLGFQAKMMQAWIVLPALALGYLFTATPALRQRVMHLLVAGLVAGAVSFSWVALYTLTPANDRPYIDGSTDNSAVSMVFGYNGFGRFGVDVAGSVAAFGSGRRGGGAGEFGDGVRGGGIGEVGGGARGVGAGSPGGGWGGRGGFGFGGQATGVSKLFVGRFVTQIGWLYPLAGTALAFGLARWFRRRGRSGRTDRTGTGLVLWGVWLATVMVVFSNINIPHTAYLAALAPPLAALSGLGIVEFWRAYRRGGRAAWLMPAVVAGQVGWSVYLARPYGDFLPWLTPVVIGIGVVAVVALVAGVVVRGGGGAVGAVRWRGGRGLRLAVAASVAGVAAMTLMPTAWALSAFDRAYDGSAMDATAGPVGGVGGGAAGGGRGGGRGFGGTDILSTTQQRLLSYVDAHKGSARYVMATTSWSTAAPYIESTGQMVLPMGGFSGTVPEPTLSAFQELVRSGQVKFVLVGGGAFGFGFGGDGARGAAGTGAGAGTGTNTVASITRWVEGACAVVPASAYGGAAEGGDARGGDAGGSNAVGGVVGGGGLYQCVG